MRPLNMKATRVSQDPPGTARPAGPAVPVTDKSLEFVGHLARRHAIAGDLLAKLTAAKRPGREQRLRDLWELTELSAEDFADEVAHFYRLPRVDLPQLLAATSLLSLPSSPTWRLAGVRWSMQTRIGPVNARLHNFLLD